MISSKPPVRVVLIAADPTVRRFVGTWLKGQSGVSLLAEAGNREEARGILRSHHPQVAFLTPKVGAADCFELLDDGAMPSRPLAVVLGQTPDQAPRAFDFDAVDFLLPPYTAPRLRAALERAGRRLATSASISRGPVPDRLPVRSDGRILLLPHDEIRFLRARNLKTEIRGTVGAHLVNQPLHELALKLPSNRFLRIHRSTVVNLDRVRQLKPKAHGDGAVVLDDGTEIPFSRTRRRALVNGLLQLQGAEPARVPPP